MKIALLGDVHANLPALDAVLADAKMRGVDQIWNIGDFVGYGAYPDEVVKRLRNEGAISIVGNYDLKVLKFPKKNKKWRSTKMHHKWLAFKWAYESLSKKSRKYLRTLPEELWLYTSGKYFLLTHGSPASNQDHLTPDTPDARLRELITITTSQWDNKVADVIVCGHSHREFSRQVDDSWFINTGSVGRPDDGDPRTCYAVLQVGDDTFQIDHFRLDYDLAAAVAAIHDRGLPEAFAQMLIQGRDLNTVLGIQSNTHPN
jgi:putative phosphoesterase